MAGAARRGDRSGLPDFELGAGDHPLTERLVRLVLDGAKTATTSLVAEFEAAGEPLPAVGGRWALLDRSGREVGVVETTKVRATDRRRARPRAAPRPRA